MPRPDVLTTARLTLRPPTDHDRDHWVRLHRDPRLYVHAPHAMPPSDEAASEDFDGVLAHWGEWGFGYHVVERGGVRIGMGGLRFRGDGAALNLAYRLDADSHGEGLASEAARAWVAHAVEWHGHPLEALVKAHNVASVRTAEAAGLVECGTRSLVDDLPDEPASLVLGPPVVEVVRGRALDFSRREAVLDLWCATNDAGGAVGFLPGADRDRVAEALDDHEASMRRGRTTGVLLMVGERAAGLGFWHEGANPLLSHTRTAQRIMTDPARRGRNLGRLLMAAMHRAARSEEVELVMLDVRSGLGTAAFYRQCGYVEVGRTAGVIRVAPGDDRDSIAMARRLDGRPMTPDGRD